MELIRQRTAGTARDARRVPGTPGVGRRSSLGNQRSFYASLLCALQQQMLGRETVDHTSPRGTGSLLLRSDACSKMIDRVRSRQSNRISTSWGDTGKLAGDWRAQLRQATRKERSAGGSRRCSRLHGAFLSARANGPRGPRNDFVRLPALSGFIGGRRNSGELVEPRRASAVFKVFGPNTRPRHRSASAPVLDSMADTARQTNLARPSAGQGHRRTPAV